MEHEATTPHQDTRGQLSPALEDDSNNSGPMGYAAVIKYDIVKDSNKRSILAKWCSHGPSPLRICAIKADFRVMNIPYPTHMYLTNAQLEEIVCYWSSALGVSGALDTYRQPAYCRHSLH